MIKSALVHAVIAVAMQGLWQFLVGWLAAGIIACSFFFGREFAQHEYKGGGPKVVSLHYGLVNHWTLDSTLDVLFPIIATGAVWLLFR